MDSDTLAVLLPALFIGFSGLITAVATNMTSAKKSQLDALSKVVELLQSDNTRILAENKRLNDKIDRLEQEIEEKDGSISVLRQWAEMLVRQVVSLGGTPVQMTEVPTRSTR